MWGQITRSPWGRKSLRGNVASREDDGNVGKVRGCMEIANRWRVREGQIVNKVMTFAAVRSFTWRRMHAEVPACG
jgi:hypothetical protein